MDVFLETERLILRRFTAADLDILVELDADPDVMFHITGGVPTSREATEEDVLPAFHFRPAPGHPEDEPELGYRLRKSAWGRGYATEGSIALIDKGFAEFGVRRVVAEAMLGNEASWRVMEKAGMSRVRVFHQEWPYVIPGDEQGDVEYAITRQEWLQRRPG